MNVTSNHRTSDATIIPSNPNVGLRAGVAIVLLCILFGANGVAIKMAYEGFGVFSAAVIRFSLAAMTIALWAFLGGRSFRLADGQWKPLLVYSILFTAQLSLFYVGLSRTYASRGTLLINMLPFLILVLAHFFIPGDRITRRKLIGLILGFGGVVCVFSGREVLSGDIRIGDGMVFLATCIWAANAVYIKRVISTFNPFHIVFYSMLFSLPFFLAGAWWFDEAAVKAFSVRALAALFYQTFVTASFGFIAWNSLLKTYGAVTLHSFVFIMPLVGLVLSGWLLNEPLSPNLWLALICIVAGILVVHFRPSEELPAFFPCDATCNLPRQGLVQRLTPVHPPCMVRLSVFIQGKRNAFMDVRTYRADALLLLTATIWGFAFVAQRVGMDYVGPFTFNGVRFALGSLSLVPLLFLMERKSSPASVLVPRASRRTVFWGGGLAGLFLFSGASLQQVGLVYTTAGNAGFITGLYVVIVPLMGLFLRQRTHMGTWLGALLAAIGLYFLSITEALTIAWGDLLVLIGAFFWAAHVLIIGRLSPRMDALKLAITQFAVCSLLSLLTAVALETLTWDGLRQAAIPILYGGVGSVGVAYTLQVVAQKDAHPAHAAIFLSMEAVFAAIGGWWLLNEVLTTRSLLGCGLMLFGMLFSQLWGFLRIGSWR